MFIISLCFEISLDVNNAWSTDLFEIIFFIFDHFKILRRFNMGNYGLLSMSHSSKKCVQLFKCISDYRCSSSKWRKFGTDLKRFFCLVSWCFTTKVKGCVQSKRVQWMYDRINITNPDLKSNSLNGNAKNAPYAHTAVTHLRDLSLQILYILLVKKAFA